MQPNLNHCTTTHNHYQVLVLSHHHKVPHHRSTLKNLPPVSLSFHSNQTTNPPRRRLIRPICLPILQRSPPLTTSHTWTRHQVSLPMSRCHKLEQPHQHNTNPHQRQFSKVLPPRTFRIYPTNHTSISTEYVVCLRLSSRSSHIHQTSSKNGTSIVTSTYKP